LGPVSWLTAWLPPLALFLALWLGLFWQLGSVPLFDLDEGAFSEATREMLESGNFITPHKDGEPRYDKPVFIYWLQAASVSLLAFDEFALRLPSALAATAWILAVWGFVRRQLDTATAWAAALVMTLTLEVSLIGRAATADAVLNLFLTLALLEIYRWQQEPDRWTLARVYLWLGLGFLTKGPVAVFFPVLVSFLFMLSRRSLGDWWRALWFPWGWLLFLAITLPWYLAIYFDTGPGFFQSFFLRHNLERFSGTLHGHAGFPGYYFAILPLILLPFTGWFLRLLPLARTLWGDPLDRFLLIWFGAVFVFFSFSGTKLPHYLLYGAVPLFILMARQRELMTNRWLAFAPPLVWFALLLLLPDVLDRADSLARGVHQAALFEEGRRVLDGSYRLAAALVLVASLGLALWRRLPAWQGLILTGFLQALLVWGMLAPRVAEVLQQPVKEAALLARELGRPTLVFRTNMPSFSVYRQAITPNREAVAGDLVFLRRDKLERFATARPDLATEILYQRGQIALILVSDAVPISAPIPSGPASGD
jgi:4-amino-4-deoxy-L-arabinose transferase-like glycosyltransferase